MEENRSRGIVAHIIARMLLCAVVIYFMNKYLASQDISVAVGINGLSLLTSAVLGIPGVALLYGILFYQNL